ncbi:MAG: preprotein translocase subunit SecE [Peptococcia bacterium]
MSVAKSEKAGLLARIRKTFRGMHNEMKKVHWPNRREMTTLTVVVIFSVAIVALIIWLVDLGIGAIVNKVFGLGL